MVNLSAAFPLLFLLLAGCASERAAPIEAATHPSVDEQERTAIEILDLHIGRAMQDWSVPGLAIAVVKDDSIWFARGYGVRSVDRAEPVDMNTLFGLMSPTKTFTTAALAILADEGRLTWDDRVVEHLPAFRVSDPRVTRELRVRDLVSHRSGYRDSPRLWYRTGRDRRELIRRMAEVEPVAPYGEEFHYNNLMYVVAGELIEAASGLSWDEFLRHRIFVPLDMPQTTTSHRPLATRENVAAPHARRLFNRFGPIRPIPYFDTDNVGPAGSIHTNVQEMSRWLRFHLRDGSVGGKQLLSPAAIRELRQPQIHIGDPADEKLGGERAAGPQRGYIESMAYGLGWFTAEYRNRPIVWHGGGITGQRSAVALLPEDGIGVVVLSNMHHTEIALALMFQALDAALGAPPRDWSAAYLQAGR
jgi:CubicO group peptidase (beta-lactamase class C family)